LTVIKEKISIIHEKTSITAGEMSIIRHPLRPGRPRTRKRRHPAVPDLNVSIDEPNGTVKFTPTKPGEYEMVCSVFCGVGHGDMKATLVVVE